MASGKQAGVNSKGTVLVRKDTFVVLIVFTHKLLAKEQRSDSWYLAAGTFSPPNGSIAKLEAPSADESWRKEGIVLG